MQALVIEDDPTLSYVWQEALKEAGFTVERAESCSEAVYLILRKNFDVCLMDVHVTDGTTFGLADWVKMRAPDTNIIAVTGSRVSPNGEMNRHSSYDYVFRKPVPISDLVAITEYVATVSEAALTPARAPTG